MKCANIPRDSLGHIRLTVLQCISAGRNTTANNMHLYNITKFVAHMRRRVYYLLHATCLDGFVLF